MQVNRKLRRGGGSGLLFLPSTHPECLANVMARIAALHQFFTTAVTGLCSVGRTPEKGQKSLSDFPSDIVTRSAAALGVVAASACCWSPVFTGAEYVQLEWGARGLCAIVGLDFWYVGRTPGEGRKWRIAEQLSKLRNKN